MRKTGQGRKGVMQLMCCTMEDTVAATDSAAAVELRCSQPGSQLPLLLLLGLLPLLALLGAGLDWRCEPAASTSAASCETMAVLSVMTAPSMTATGTFLYSVHFSCPLVRGLTSTVRYGICTHHVQLCNIVSIFSSKNCSNISPRQIFPPLASVLL